MKKKSLGREIIESLGEALAHRRGEITLRTTHVDSLQAPPTLSADAIARLRAKRLHVSQPIFARLLGVSSSTVKAWEQGVKKPNGPARRLLQIVSKDPAQFLAAVER